MFFPPRTASIKLNARMSFRTKFYQRLQRRHRRLLGADRAMPLLDWGRAFLPEHFRAPPSLMHDWLGQQLDAMAHTRGVKLNVIGPRGGAKSTVGTLAGVLRAALEGWEAYIWIVSDTRNQAYAHLENVRRELLDNRPLREAYPQLAQGLLRSRAGAIGLASGVAIEAFGTGQKIRGRRNRQHRPSLIVCDDVQNDAHIESALQRETSLRWFQGTLLKAGNTQSNIVNLATALHRDALALELHRTPGWTSRIFRAIEVWPHDLALWQQWETIYANRDRADATSAARTFYDLHRAAMDDGAVLLWPEEESLYTLMCMRVESGRSAFEREKQGSPIDPQRCEWPDDYFGPWIWFDQWPTNLSLRTLALDPSKGGDARRGDYSAFVMLGVDDRGTLFVEADLARRPSPQIVAEGAALCARFQPHAFGVESNQYQELLGEQFAAEFVRQRILTVTPYAIDNRVNKLVRIRRLGPYLAARRMRFKSQCASTRLLIEQLRDFPIGDHDDGPDALEMAVRLAAEMRGES